MRREFKTNSVESAEQKTTSSHLTELAILVRHRLIILLRDGVVRPAND